MPRNERDQQAELIDALSNVFDRLRSSVFVTDRFAAVKYLNTAAKRLLGASRGLSVHGDRLVAGDADATTALKSSVFKAAMAATTERVNVAERLVTIPEPTGKNPLLVAISPLDKETRQSGQPVQMLAVLIVIDPEQRLETNHKVLQCLYGLTTAEAEVTARFVGGESPREIAGRTDRSYETVRWHLKQVMSKVGVKQQTDLLRIVHSAVLPLTDD